MKKLEEANIAEKLNHGTEIAVMAFTKLKADLQRMKDLPLSFPGAVGRTTLLRFALEDSKPLVSVAFENMDAKPFLRRTLLWDHETSMCVANVELEDDILDPREFRPRFLTNMLALVDSAGAISLESP